MITTSHKSVIDVRDTFAVDQARHGRLRFLTGLACSATRWLGMSASRWVGMTGDGKGPAGGVGGALWCPGCRGGGRVVVVSRCAGDQRARQGRGGVIGRSPR